jgi:C1A family cysteine protease
MGDYKPVTEFPFYKKPSEWLKIEHQGSMGSCQGHALSSCVEVSYYFETGETVQLSRMYAYIKSQMLDNITSDRGSTISAGGKVATRYGVPPEDAWPYTGRYSRKIPIDANEKAAKYKVEQAVRLVSYDDVMNFLRSGLGAVNIGVRWGRGGHAVCITEEHGEGGVKVANSWGENWGEQGWFTWSEREFKTKMKESYTRAVGITDMVDIEPREVQWNKAGEGFML